MKVNEKISSVIALTQDELNKEIKKVKTVLENIFSLYIKLCDSSYFTQETSQKILSLEGNLKVSSSQLPINPTQSEKHFTTLLHTQKELDVLIVEEANIKAKLVQIQSAITPHMEVLYKEHAYAKNVLQKDPNLSTLDGLVHLAVETTIQLKALQIALDNWDAALKIILEVNKTFLAKYSIHPQEPLT